MDAEYDTLHNIMANGEFTNFADKFLVNFNLSWFTYIYIIATLSELFQDEKHLRKIKTKLQ